jgi:predicted MFS family arabinose efflux permease
MTDRPADRPADRHHAPRRLAAFFAGAFCWNLGLGMAHLAVPLYAYSLGWSGVEIGSLVAFPVLVQIWINLLSGAWADRAGGRALAVLACAATLAAGLLFAAGQDFAMLLAGQSAFIVSRALFWPATWSLATQFPGDRSRTLGRLNATTSLGQILGTGAAGIALAQAGFPATFVALALVGGVAAGACLLAFDAPRPRPSGPRTPLFAAYARLARRRSIYYAVLCAYVSGLPLSMSMSFYPILLATHGFSSEASGWLIALRGVGSVTAGFVAGRYVTRTADPRAPLAGALAVAVSVLLVAAWPHAAPISLFLFAVGVGSGVLTLYFQLLISDLSAPGERGAALALGGLGWGLSHLTTPLIMGALQDAFGIVAAFEAVGVLSIAWSAALWPLHRWAFRHGRPA